MIKRRVGFGFPNVGVLLAMFLLTHEAGLHADTSLDKGFQQPPFAAKPRTWWHWVSGNVSKEGITADLEALKRIGVAGAQIFTVDQSDVKGHVVFMSPEWRGLVKHALSEAARLNLEISMEGCDGWSESGGHWVQPAQSMQKVTWSEAVVQGGTNIPLTLPQPESRLGYYEDIALVAFKAPPGNLVPDATARSGMQVNMHLPFDTNSASLHGIDPKEIIDLTGKTNWTAPQGTWTILRIGHTSTGETTHPSTSPGLECDKLSTAAVNSHIDHLFKPVWEDSPDKPGSTFKFILLDSWECGCENWTPLMAEEFRKRRGYDLQPWLPALTGHIVGSVEETERFLWDYRRTLADLVAENHYGFFQKRAHEKGMGLMSEATGIGLPTVADQLLCKKYCDVPMGEFWVNSSRDGNIDDPKEAASAAHLYGQNIASCESFTSVPETAAWKNDPFSLKALGDQEFCNGVNRFTFHRYAHQPWLDRKPGMCMGPWGINFERTNTWWNEASAWIDYLSRCEFLLQQGRFCADLCYFYGEGAPVCVHHGELTPAVPKGYDYDVCNADILLNLMETKDGRITTPSGMSYRVLVLPPEDRMTLPVLRKIAKLVHDGAVVYGPKPFRSPSLSGYPGVDQEVSRLADEVWGNCDGKSVTEHSYGAGKIVWGASLEKALNVPPDFSTPKGDYLFIHRKVASTDRKSAQADHKDIQGGCKVAKQADTEIYFVSNQGQQAITTDCSFRGTGKIPELWHPDTGKRETVALYTDKDGLTTLPIHFDPVGSVFVIFQIPQTPAPHPVSLAFTASVKNPKPAPKNFEILKATYGAGDKTVDVTARIASLIENGRLSINAATAALNVADPAPNVVKQLVVEYKLNGETGTKTIPENGKVDLGITQPFIPETSLRTDAQNQTVLSAALNGDYFVTFSDGTTKSVAVAGLPAPLTLEGSWNLVFPPFTEGKGEPVKAAFDKLISWSDSPVDSIKYFSGTATYTKTFTLPEGYRGKKRLLFLDLGSVDNIAEVNLNGKSLGILWKEPFQADATKVIKKGNNKLTIKVTNLWPNRLIGDQRLPEKDRATWASVSLYKATDPLLPSGLLGPVRIIPAQTIGF